jgi:hypothetical protein
MVPRPTVWAILTTDELAGWQTGARSGTPDAKSGHGPLFLFASRNSRRVIASDAQVLALPSEADIARELGSNNDRTAPKALPPPDLADRPGRSISQFVAGSGAAGAAAGSGKGSGVSASVCR